MTTKTSELNLTEAEATMIENMRNLNLAPLGWNELRLIKTPSLSTTEARVVHYLRTVGVWNLTAALYDVYELGIGSYPDGIDFQSNKEAYVTTFDFIGVLHPRPSVHLPEPTDSE